MDITQPARVLKRVLLRTFPVWRRLGPTGWAPAGMPYPAGIAGRGAGLGSPETAVMGTNFVLKCDPKISLDSRAIALLKITGILKVRERATGSKRGVLVFHTVIKQLGIVSPASVGLCPGSENQP